MCKAVEEVKIVVDFPSATADSRAPSETSKREQVVPYVLVSPIKIQVSKTVVKFGNPDSNLVY